MSAEPIDMTGVQIGPYVVLETAPRPPQCRPRLYWWVLDTRCHDQFRLSGGNLRKMQRGRWTWLCNQCDADAGLRCRSPATA